MQTFHMGLTTLEQEVNLSSLPIRGEIPAWLSGALYRNGPAYFQGGHWFDGLAMIHKFSFQQGAVAYANRVMNGSHMCIRWIPKQPGGVSSEP